MLLSALFYLSSVRTAPLTNQGALQPGDSPSGFRENVISLADLALVVPAASEFQSYADGRRKIKVNCLLRVSAGEDCLHPPSKKWTLQKEAFLTTPVPRASLTGRRTGPLSQTFPP